MKQDRQGTGTLGGAYCRLADFGQSGERVSGCAAACNAVTKGYWS